MTMRKTLPLLATAYMMAASTSVFATEFDQTLTLEGISFKVHATDKSSFNTLAIKPKGLKRENRPISKEIDGTVMEAEVADLNADGSPEILVYIMSPGPGNYGRLVGYIAEHKMALAPIDLPDISSDSEASAGYMGHDEFAVVESRLARRFPVYRPGDNTSNPTGGLRQLYYILIAGKEGWTFKLDEIVNFSPEDLAEN